MQGFSPKNILIPTDLSENAQKAIEYALSLAKAYGAKLHIYYVITDLQAALGYVPSLPLDKIEASMRQEAENYFEHIKNKILKDFDNFDMHIEVGDAPKKIVEFATNNDIDLIVMGAQGKSALERFVFGSTTEKVLRMSKKPILVVKM
ncbi:MAG: universal stress protein [Desulfurella sp.]|uniref:universal stress protein n=1 Tax=Desulfurella TaxID=33001 RepID=UPI0003E0967A|nr:universal stress protein [Desulfurella multipotens]AHF98205.1 hypothetical protein DESACE_08655 [Desulfurella acetivorans A63]PMP68171.1 MAG: universal stress protein [Desulfurella multipotens]